MPVRLGLSAFRRNNLSISKDDREDAIDPSRTGVTCDRLRYPERPTFVAEALTRGRDLEFQTTSFAIDASACAWIASRHRTLPDGANHAVGRVEFLW
jgi:hypothetical protein